MKIQKTLLACVSIAIGFIGLWSCSDDDDPERILREIIITGDVEIDGSKVRETNTVSLKYNEAGKLTEYRESNNPDQAYTLSYEENKVIFNRNGEYCGEFTLNDQGYAISFSHPYSATYYHEYSENGYLMKSTFRTSEYTYSYLHGNLVNIDVRTEGGDNNVTFTMSDQIDTRAVPSFHQPVYLQIPGNIEVRIGYLAGLYGKVSRNLVASTTVTTGLGKPWKYVDTITYTYETDRGYVIEQSTMNKSPYGDLYTGTLEFKY